jgi:hypothetical protein
LPVLLLLYHESTKYRHEVRGDVWLGKEQNKEEKEHQCIQVERLKGFDLWQHDQNGCINRVEEKLDRLIDTLQDKLTSVEKEAQTISHRVSNMEGFKRGQFESEKIYIGRFKIKNDKVAIYIAGIATLIAVVNVLSNIFL